jgi:hypothetical protein
MASNYAFKRTAGTVHMFPDPQSARGRLTRRWAAMETLRRILFVALALAVAAACAPASQLGPASTSDWWSGAALLEDNGSIIVKAAATQHDGTVAHLYAEYLPGHEQYETIRKHVGEIQVGEWKRIPPFPLP